MTDDKHESELQIHQDGRVYPLGRALRSTYDAENHESLGSDVTGLMIDLSKIPYEPDGVRPASPLPAESVPPRSWTTRLGTWLGRRQSI